MDEFVAGPNASPHAAGLLFNGSSQQYSIKHTRRMNKIKGEVKTLIKDAMETMVNKDDRVVAAYLKRT